MTAPKPSRLRVTLYRDIDAAPRKRFLVERFLGAGEASCIYGAPGAAKSMLATDLACHVAAGQQWFGRRVSAGAVLYVAAERAELTKRRLAAFRRHHGIDDIPLAVVAGAVDLRSPQQDVALITGHAKDLREIAGTDVALIIVDTVSRTLAGGDENSPKDMGTFVANMTALQEATGAHITVIHHVPQNGDARLRGHGALLGGLDTTISIEKAGDNRVATIVKDNDGAEGQSLAFSLQSVVLSTDAETGLDTTAPIVIPAEGPVARPTPKRKLSDRQKLALDALSSLCVDGKPLPASFGLPATLRGVAIDVWRDDLLARAVLEKDAANPRQDFVRLRNALKVRGHIGERDSLVWRAA